MLRIVKSFLVCLLVVCFAVPAVFAAKPVKLSEAEMAEVHGAIAPLILAAGGAFAMACAIDELKGQYDYFSNKPEALAPVSKSLSKTLNNLNGLINPALIPANSITAAKISKKDAREFNLWAKYTGDQNIKIMTRSENVISGLTGGAAEFAGPIIQTAAGPVKLGATGIGALMPVFKGSATALAKVAVESAVTIPGTCLVNNDWTLNQINSSTLACMKNGAINTIENPFTLLEIVSGGITRGESYNTRSGSGSSLSSASNLNNVIGLLSDLPIGQTAAKASATTPAGQYQCVAAVNPTPTKATTNAKQYQCAAPPSSSGGSSGRSSGSSSGSSSTSHSSSGSSGSASSGGSGASTGQASAPSSSPSVSVATHSDTSSINNAARSGSISSLTPTQKAILASHM